MAFLFDRRESHRWFDNTRQWLALYRERGLSLDRIAFENDLMPGLSGMKLALLYYAAQRAMYLLQCELLATVFRIEQAEWAEDVDALAAQGLEEYIRDVRTLLGTLDLDLGEPFAPEHYLRDPQDQDWADALHKLEESNLARPQDEPLLTAWLRACLDAKLAEVAQSLRRAALGYWLMSRFGADMLAAAVEANLEPFAWRISNRIHERFVEEKVDPRTGRPIRWTSTRTDSEIWESATLSGQRMGDRPLQTAGGAVKTFIDAAARGRPIKGMRRVSTCPRADVFARIRVHAQARWGDAADADIRRVFCKFCFMHAYAEMVRNVPAFITIERIEGIPYHSKEGRCAFRWEFGIHPTALLGRGKDAARMAHVARASKAPPELVFVDELAPESGADLAHSTWDRGRLR
ncbi:MAG: hypothetical protein ACYC5M_11240 [Anaerolineae bacterium]